MLLISPIRGEGYEFLAHIRHTSSIHNIISHHTYRYIELYTRTRVARNIINNNALMSWNIPHLFFFFFLICNNSKRTTRRCRWCGPVRDSFALGHQSQRFTYTLFLSLVPDDRTTIARKILRQRPAQIPRICCL